MLQLLLVDDESYVVDDMEIAFPWIQYGIDKVHKAYSGAEALQIIKDHTIDIVITDIAMPMMTGLELITHIKKHNKAIKCILLTGYAEFEYAQEAIQQGAVDYLLKPLEHSKLALCLEKTIHSIRAELEQIASYEKVLLTFKEHLPVLKDKLLNELLLGKSFSDEALEDKLSDYSLTFRQDEDIFLMVIRLEEHFIQYGSSSLLLFEYAVTNIACELLEEDFETWHCRDSYDYLVFLLKTKQSDEQKDIGRLMKDLTHRCLQLHRNVNDYLGGGISVILSYPGKFRSDIRLMYDHAVAAIRKQLGNETGYFSALTEPPEMSSVGVLSVLYNPPTFIQLLETNQWDGFRDRLDHIEKAFNALSEQTQEHLDAIRTVIMTSFHYIAHRNSTLLSDLVGSEFMSRQSFHTLPQLMEWTRQFVDQLQEKLEKDASDQQQAIIRGIQAFISANLSTVCLQSIADHVTLHPVYVSKLFKQICNVNISEYIHGLKMEQAIVWLRDTTDKIYEISEQLGYSNSQYFIKVFKDKYRMTPQDYRDQFS